jgi:hypothetical protein
MLTVLRHNQRCWSSECNVATGRSAIKLLIDRSHPKSVLMPCYVPEGVINPFQVAGVPIKFYKLRDDLRPDLDHISKLICKGSMVVAIHYFGYLTETGALREMVSQADGILFEDCAHALFAKADDADVALWSYNKFLPVVDGAILRSRRHNINVSPLYPMPQIFPQRILTAYHQHLELNSRLSRVQPEQAEDLLKESTFAYEAYYSQIKDLTLYQQSDESRCVIANTNLKWIENSRTMRAFDYFQEIPDCFRFRGVSPKAPFAYPIVVRHPINCEDVYQRLLKVGVLAARLIDKWDHIPKGDERFLAEHIFMDQHLLLPVGEEVTYDDVKRIGKCLKGIEREHRNNC